MTEDTPRLNTFPIFLRVEGEAVVIAGDGDEALAKARLLSQSSAALRIVSADPSPNLLAWIAANDAEHVTAPYAADHLAGAVMVFRR